MFLCRVVCAVIQILLKALRVCAICVPPFDSHSHPLTSTLYGISLRERPTGNYKGGHGPMPLGLVGSMTIPYDMR